MSAEALLQEARACGVELKLLGGNIVLEADRPPPSDLLDRLRASKPDVVRLFKTASRHWSRQDWRGFVDERAAIAEFDGGLPRKDAEHQAFEECVREWLRVHSEPSVAGTCACCGNANTGYSSVVVPFEAAYGKVWLHAACWDPWSRARRERAVIALANLGIGDSCKG